MKRNYLHGNLAEYENESGDRITVQDCRMSYIYTNPGFYILNGFHIYKPSQILTFAFKTRIEAATAFFKAQKKARNLAIEWQVNFANRDRSWEYCAKWKNLLARIANQFNLTSEFEKNGII